MPDVLIIDGITHEVEITKMEKTTQFVMKIIDSGWPGYKQIIEHKQPVKIYTVVEIIKEKGAI